MKSHKTENRGCTAIAIQTAVRTWNYTLECGFTQYRSETYCSASTKLEGSNQSATMTIEWLGSLFNFGFQIHATPCYAYELHYCKKNSLIIMIIVTSICYLELFLIEKELLIKIMILYSIKYN